MAGLRGWGMRSCIGRRFETKKKKKLNSTITPPRPRGGTTFIHVATPCCRPVLPGGIFKGTTQLTIIKNTKKKEKKANHASSQRITVSLTLRSRALFAIVAVVSHGLPRFVFDECVENLRKSER